MTSLARGVLDTSVFIADENGRPLNRALMPAELAVSVVTAAELHAGGLGAPDLDSRAQRLRTLDVLADVTILPIDERVAVEWARLRVYLAQRQQRVGVNDLWIAATCCAHDLPVVTQDDDFAALQEGSGVSVIRV